MSSGATSPSSSALVLAANNGKFNQPTSEVNKDNNKPMVEISIDTSSQFVEVRQQDSGSNQSGSDSGLGYTNSISSDNSSFNVASNQDQAASKQKINSNIGSSNNSNTLLTHNDPSSSITTQTSKEVELSAIDESRTSSTEPNKKQSPKSGLKSDQTPQFQFKSDDELERHPQSVTHRNDELVSTIQPSATVIKSILKKSSQINDANSSTDQHNRNVSFNQTVIVFCEETELPSLVDQFDPPVGYQDSMSTFEPPEDYCDLKDERIEKNPVDSNGSETSAVTFSRILKNSSASSLNDDQLFGLLDNDSLIESLKIDCEDVSEDDFRINYLSSNHSYLCNDAISDYDSDSESSLYAERDRHNSVLPNSIRSAKNVEEDASIDIKSKIYNQEKPSLSPSNAGKDAQFSNDFKYLRDEQLPLRSSKLVGNQKSMPARMKVSTVDSSHSKRNSGRKEGVGLKPKSELSQSSCGKQTHSERQTADAQLVATRLTPIVIKQSTVEPVSLSKPIVVGSNLCNPEKPSNIDKTFKLEPTTVTSNSKPLVASEQTNLTKEYNLSRETVISQTQKLQYFNQATANMNQTRTSSQQTNQPACQVCRVIGSNQSQTNPEQKAVNPQDVRAVKSFIQNNVERENHESLPIQVQFVRAQNNQPIVFNQSCVSCREALLKQQQSTQENTGTRITAQQPSRSVTYQLVYVVDQKGNRVRALSVRPALNAPVTSLQQAALAGGRILIAQNGQRFLNPISFTDQMNNNLQKNPQVTAHQLSQNIGSTNNTQRYRIIETAQPQIAQPVQHRMELRGQQVSYIRSVPPTQKVPLEFPGLRQHTVYYVRQPLETQNIRQSYDAARSSCKSFPDPHEIRRLDGLRGPTAAMSLSRGDHNTEPRVTNHVSIKSDEPATGNELPREDMDDPTFGFSKRPSVKVVSTSSSHSPLCNLTIQANRNANILLSNHEHYLNSNNASTLNRCSANQPVGATPISLVAMDSQTLDRRLVSQGKAIKENIPSTSSMSNIHGTLVGIPPSKLSNMNANQLQQRISNVQIINSNMDKLSPKGMSYSSVKRWLSNKLTQSNSSAD